MDYVLSTIPDNYNIEVRYEGDGISTIWPGPGEGNYRAFVWGPDDHASDQGEGYGETRSEAVLSAWKDRLTRGPGRWAKENQP